jgi:hypothetical protein
VSPVKYKLGFYIPEDDILHSHRRENLKSYTAHFLTSYLFSLPKTFPSPKRRNTTKDIQDAALQPLKQEKTFKRHPNELFPKLTPFARVLRG